MKKVMGIIYMIATTAVMAGGDLSPVASTMSETERPCNVEKVYVDPATSLMWQDAPYTDAEDGAYAREHSVEKAGSWRHAVNYCRRLDYAGYTDWRLPTADELTDIHQLVGQVFANFRDRDFWTSTPTVNGKYYVVYAADAYRYKRSKRESNYIRCVRCTAK
jgi:hypothetical protein